MTVLEAIEVRHSVRAYKDIPIKEGIRKELDAFIEECNRESGLHIFAKYDDPDGFDSRLAHYGRFRNVGNYIVLSGKKTEDFDFLCGYFWIVAEANFRLLVSARLAHFFSRISETADA